MMSYCYSVAYLGPSVTPYQHNNPAYRIYEMEGVHNNTTFQLVDHHVYFLNLTTANSENNATWQYLYGAKVRGNGNHVIQCMTSLTLGIIWVEEPTASGVV